MTDPELLAKKLAFVESCVADLRRLAIAENIDSDVKERRFVEHTLQLAIQAAGRARIGMSLATTPVPAARARNTSAAVDAAARLGAG